MRARFVSIQVASARDVAERWRDQYDRDGWIKTASGPSKDIYDKLCDLGPTPAIDAVAEIIGNQSWSYISCDGCSEYVERAVRIGRPDEGGHHYCTTCIQEAHQIFGEKV